VLALRFAFHVPSALLVLVALYPVAWIGVRRSLDPACWPETGLFSRLKELPGMTKEAARHLGWPHGPLGPRPLRSVFAGPERVLVPLLVGWLVYAILSQCLTTRSDEMAASALIGAFTAFLCFLRTFAYVGRYWSPISLVGRLLTGRWIIPGYDKVFVGPLATISVYLTLEVPVWLLGVPAVIVQPLVAAACLATWMNVGPTLCDWQLTGGHRISTLGFQMDRTQFRQV